MTSLLLIAQIQLSVVPSSFEALCLSIAPHRGRGSVSLLTIHRSSKITRNDQFHEEFSSTLEELVARNSQSITLVDYTSSILKLLLLRQHLLLTQFGLRQHVNESTCRSGRWLDLVGRGGALVMSTPFLRRVVGSIHALAAT